MIVSKQSAVKAGEKIKTFLTSFFEKSSRTSSVKGVHHLFVNLV